MLKRISAILLSVLLLVVNMSLTFSTHFCGGEAVETSVSLGKADVGCGMEDALSNDCDSPLQETISKNCCSNEHYTLSLDEDYKENAAQETETIKSFDVAVIGTNAVEHHFLTAVNNFAAYSPPLVKRDRTVMHQVFRL